MPNSHDLFHFNITQNDWIWELTITYIDDHLSPSPSHPRSQLKSLNIFHWQFVFIILDTHIYQSVKQTLFGIAACSFGLYPFYSLVHIFYANSRQRQPICSTHACYYTEMFTFTRIIIYHSRFAHITHPHPFETNIYDDSSKSNSNDSIVETVAASRAKLAMLCATHCL